MRRISRPRTSDPAFSLVELIVAIAILALLVGATARALMTSMRGEESGELLLSGRLALARVDTAIANGIAADKLAETVPAGWQLRDQSIETGPKTNIVVWRQLELRSEQRPSLSVSLWLPAKR